jgi:hypothetical protein
VKPCFGVIYVKTGINSDMSEKSYKKQIVRQLDTAQRYAAEDFAVPLHGTNGGQCTCGRTDCERPGKHPRTTHGIQDATDVASTEVR